jgi:hypothetical protein
MLLRTAFAAGATITLAGAAALAAAPAGATTAQQSTGAATTAAQPLKGYRTILGAPVASPSQTQTRGKTLCPTGTVVLGGGVSIVSSDPLVSINSSFPAFNGWVADVGNASGSATTFAVNVICAVKPAHYKIVTKTVLNPAATHTSVSATCPTGTKPLGGGAASNGASNFITLSTSAPTGTRSWGISENNATGTDHLISVLAVCGTVQGYSVVHGPSVSVRGPSVTSVGSSCPRGHAPTGGGAAIQSSSVGAFLNSTTFGDANDWNTFVTNTSAVPFKASTTVVCAALLE